MLPLRDNIRTDGFPVVTVALIALNAVAWLLYQLPDLEGSVRQAGFFPCQVTATCPDPGLLPVSLRPAGAGWIADAFSSMFLHGSWIHLIGNMVFLWIFGKAVEDRMGRSRYIAFYLAAGLTATALQSAITLALGTEIDGYNIDALIPTIGASGALAGVLGAYFVLFPRARVLTIFFIFLILPLEIPAFIFLGGWFAFQLWQGGFELLAPDGIGAGGVAFFAHVGGFLFGAVTVKLIVATRRVRPAQHPPWERAER